MPYKDPAKAKQSAAKASRRFYLRHRKDPLWVEKSNAASLTYRRTKTTSESRMLGSAKSRAKKSGVPFNLELSDIVIPKVCPLLGITIVEGHLKGKRGPSANSPSLDRIRPELGYVKGNVWVISHRANVIKQNASPEELETIAKHLRKAMMD